jgi:hypothetical protein
VPAESLTLTITLPNGVPSRSKYAGLATVGVRVRNPYNYDIRIDTLGTHAFRAEMRTGVGHWQSDRWLWSPRALHFAPYETKRATFDLVLGGHGLSPLEYFPDTLRHEFRIAFGNHWSAPLTLTSVR